ncbi:MAG TPA: hypothetical protein VIM79_12795 [Niastella sp.]
MKDYLTLNTISELFCLAIGIFCLYRDKDKVWKSFILFLLFTCLTELAGVYVRKEYHTNFWIYNIYLVVECVVTNYFLYHLINPNQHLRKLLMGWFVIFLCFYFNELYVKHFNAYVSAATTFLSVELILASIYYYYRLLKEESYRKLSKDASFWWVNGTICFYFAGIATNIFFSYLLFDKTYITKSVSYFLFSLQNVILYSCWSYSFICRYLQRSSSP